MTGMLVSPATFAKTVGESEFHVEIDDGARVALPCVPESWVPDGVGHAFLGGEYLGVFKIRGDWEAVKARSVQ